MRDGSLLAKPSITEPSLKSGQSVQFKMSQNGANDNVLLEIYQIDFCGFIFQKVQCLKRVHVDSGEFHHVHGDGVDDDDGIVECQAKHVDHGAVRHGEATNDFSVLNNNNC